jgi:hypothetical protein
MMVIADIYVGLRLQTVLESYRRVAWLMKARKLYSRMRFGIGKIWKCC